jgi:hypothetical protein
MFSGPVMRVGQARPTAFQQNNSFYYISMEQYYSTPSEVRLHVPERVPRMTYGYGATPTPSKFAQPVTLLTCRCLSLPKQMPELRHDCLLPRPAQFTIILPFKAIYCHRH